MKERYAECYVSGSGRRYELHKGTRVLLDGFGCVFARKSGSRWHLTDARTGLMCSYGSTKKDAIAHAQENIALLIKAAQHPNYKEQCDSLDAFWCEVQNSEDAELMHERL